MTGAQLEARLTPGPDEATLGVNGCLFTFLFVSWMLMPQKLSYPLIFLLKLGH